MFSFDKKDDDSLYSIRLLIFLEIEPQSNKYHQVVLTIDQLAEVTKNIAKDMNEKDTNGNDIVKIIESDDTYDLPDLREHI